MNPVTLFRLFFTPTRGWQDLLSSHPSIPRLFMLHVIPFALIPSVMIYLAGRNNTLPILELLPDSKLLLVAIAFFIIQLIAVPVMAMVVRQLGEVAEIHPSFRDSFILAAVAPTPLWMAPIFLAIPNTLILLAVITLALMASAGFIYYGVPTVFNIKEEGHAMLYFGGILIAGVVASGFLMVCTLVIWGGLQNLQFAAG